MIFTIFFPSVKELTNEEKIADYRAIPEDLQIKKVSPLIDTIEVQQETKKFFSLLVGRRDNLKVIRKIDNRGRYHYSTFAIVFIHPCFLFHRERRLLRNRR